MTENFDLEQWLLKFETQEAEVDLYFSLYFIPNYAKDNSYETS